MTFDPRILSYPLDALHKREGWRLDSLQAELATAARRLAESSATHAALRGEQHAIVQAGALLPAAPIDPVLAQGRLRFLGAMQARMKAAAHAVAELERARDQIDARRRSQQTRLESIERHRELFLRNGAAETERRAGAEADRDWLARTQWQLPAPGRDADPGDAGRIGGARGSR